MPRRRFTAASRRTRRWPTPSGSPKTGSPHRSQISLGSKGYRHPAILNDAAGAPVRLTRSKAADWKIDRSASASWAVVGVHLASNAAQHSMRGPAADDAHDADALRIDLPIGSLRARQPHGAAASLSIAGWR